MARYGLLIDVTRCNGCYNCQIACKDEFFENYYPPYSLPQPRTGHFWIRIEEKERGKYPWVKVTYTPIPCMHCENAPCMKGDAAGAVYRRKDGIVLIDPEKAKGLKGIVDSCPYGVIYWNDELKVPQKCTLCAHLLDKGWKEPRCVDACPTLALRFGDLDDSNSEISKAVTSKNIEHLYPEFGTNPRVLYASYPKLFIAGSVVFGDTDECGEGASVSLWTPSGVEVHRQKANSFGDFEFDNVGEQGSYQLKISAEGYETKFISVDLKGDIYLGEIVLHRR